jgi:IS5 family transposase
MLMTFDFFRNRLDQLIDLRHPLAVLANRMPWQEIEASLAHRFARQVRSGKRIEDILSSTLAKCKVLISLGSSQ